MADALISNDWFGNSHFDQVVGPIWTGETTAYLIYHDTGFLIRYRKTTDGGQTWGAAVTLMTGTSAWASFGVWYDRWTPGNTGTKIRVIGAWGSVTYYCDLDTSSDTVSGTVTVASGQSATSGSVAASIVVAKSGNLVAVVMRASTTQTAYKSVDNGANWSAITLPGTTNDTVGTVLQLHPGTEADTSDVWLIQWLNSTSAIVQKVYDDSANTWGAPYSIGSIAPSFSAMVNSATRLSDGHVFIAAGDGTWNLSPNIRCYEVTGNGTSTDRTNILTTTNYILSAHIMVDEQSDILYASYLKGATGATDITVYYKTSNDSGVTWGAEQTYSSTTYNGARRVWSDRNINNGGRFYLVWVVISTNSAYQNYSSSILIEGPAPAGGAGSIIPLSTIFME